ncbi:MAG: DUF6323 family protein [Oscillibacter sp.]
MNEKLFSAEILALGTEKTVEALRACNAQTAPFGLKLSEEELMALTAGRTRALRDTGRVEFGGGILPALALAFCDSPYLQAADYGATLLALQGLFYHFKNEFREQMEDDELLKLLRRAYDEKAHGAVGFLAGMTTAALCGKEEKPKVATDES